MKRLQFEYYKFLFKLRKMQEFFNMYREWVIFFDKKSNELYKQRYGTIQ